MDITIGQLRLAIAQCTPGAPLSYADRIWEALGQTCVCDAGNGVPHRRHDWCTPSGATPTGRQARTAHQEWEET
jgi:hypothetical protein